MPKIDDKLQEVLERFASNFAQHYNEEPGDDYWWGHDTNLGTQSSAFAVAKRSIRAIKLHQFKKTGPKQFDKFKEMGYINRDAVARAVWGRSVPGWWKGSTAEWSVLSAIARVKN